MSRSSVFAQKKYLFLCIVLCFLLTGIGISVHYMKPVMRVPNAEIANQLVLKEIARQWDGISDGCGLNCPSCGITHTKQTQEGYAVTFAYMCGMKMEPELQYKTVQVSNAGSVSGFEVPTVVPVTGNAVQKTYPQ